MDKRAQLRKTLVMMMVMTLKILPSGHGSATWC